MFVETKREGEVQAQPKNNQPFGDVIKWLEQQPANGTYDWDDCEHCLCAQAFGIRIGWARPNRALQLQTGIDLNKIAYQEPRTFGAALERLRAEIGG